MENIKIIDTVELKGHHCPADNFLRTMFGPNDPLIKSPFMVDYKFDLDLKIYELEEKYGHIFNSDVIRVLCIDNTENSLNSEDSKLFDEISRKYDLDSLIDLLAYIQSDHDTYLVSQDRGDPEFYRMCAVTAMRHLLNKHSGLSQEDVVKGSFNMADAMLREYRKRVKIITQHNI